MRRLPLILLPALLCLLPPAVYLGLLPAHGPTAARIATFPLAVAALATGILLAGALLANTLPSHRARWTALALAFACALPPAACVSYHGEYDQEFQVESLTWQLQQLPPASRPTAPQFRTLLTLRTTTPDPQCRTDITAKLKSLTLPP